MTALDQAFIKAFTRQGTSATTALPRSAVATPERSSARSAKLQGEKELPTSDGMKTGTGSATNSGSDRAMKQAVAEPVPVFIRPESGTLEDDRQPLSEASPNPVAKLPSPASLAPVVDIKPASLSLAMDGVLAALETPPKGASISNSDSRLSSEAVNDMNPPESKRTGLDSDFLAPATVAFPLGGHLPTTVVSADQGPPTRQLQPAWRVDHFTWPRVCRRLIARAADELDRLADALLAANTQGQKVLAIAGYRHGEGATTLLLCAARRLAERGLKLLLIDADAARPRLAKRLGVQPQTGWDETALEEDGSLAHAIVEATGNNLAILPLREPSAESRRSAGGLSQLGQCIEMLRSQYDMLLVDLGPLENAGLASASPGWAAPGTIDGIVLVRDHRVTSEEELMAVQGKLAVAGVAAVGIVENFVIEG